MIDLDTLLLAKKLAGGGGEPGDITVVRLNATENKTYTAPSGKAYSPVVVNVPMPELEQKSVSVTQNGSMEITPTDGKDGMTKVSLSVNVPNPSSGSLEITANGTYNVTDKAQAVVNVPNPSTGSLDITDNGTYDVTEKASAVVNVPKGIPIEISTAEGMTAVLISANVGRAYKFTGTTDETYTNGDIYIVEESV